MHAQYMSQEFCSMTVQCLIMFDHVWSVQRYSTCTLNHWENEGVCEQLLLRSDCERIELQPLGFPVDLSGLRSFKKKGTERTGILNLASSTCQKLPHGSVGGDWIILTQPSCKTTWYCIPLKDAYGHTSWMWKASLFRAFASEKLPFPRTTMERAGHRSCWVHQRWRNWNIWRCRCGISGLVMRTKWVWMDWKCMECMECNAFEVWSRKIKHGHISQIGLQPSSTILDVEEV